MPVGNDEEERGGCKELNTERRGTRQSDSMWWKAASACREVTDSHTHLMKIEFLSASVSSHRCLVIRVWWLQTSLGVHSWPENVISLCSIHSKSVPFLPVAALCLFYTANGTSMHLRCLLLPSVDTEPLGKILSLQNTTYFKDTQRKQHNLL